MKRIAILIFMLQSCLSKNELEISSFDLSFNDGWFRTNSYKLDEDGNFYFSLTSSHIEKDTLSGERKLLLNELDSIKAVLKNVISDSLIPIRYQCKDCGYQCFDCGVGIIILNDREYLIRNNQNSIRKLFRIEKFIQIDSSSKYRLNNLIFKSLDKLRKTKE